MCIFFINTLSNPINLSDKEIVVYLLLGTRNFSLHKNLQTELALKHTPTPRGSDVKYDYHRLVLRVKKRGYTGSLRRNSKYLRGGSVDYSE
jgi:hypothetical protein